MSRAITVLVAGGAEGADGLDVLEGVLWGFLKNPKGTRFEVPTTEPSALLGALGDRFPLWPLGARLHQGAAGPFGVSTLRSMRRTDLVLLVGALDGRVSPALALAALAAKRLARPLVAYGIAITPAGEGAMRRWLLGRCDEVVVRDGASEMAARHSPAAVTGRADPVFHLRGAASKAVAGILGAPPGGRLGVELDALVGRGLDPADAVRAVAAATGVEPILFAGGPATGHGALGERRVLCRADYRAETWTGLLGALDLFVGRRPAWLMRSVAMGVPVVALGDGPDTLEDLGLAGLRTREASTEGLARRTATSWEERGDLALRVRAASAPARDTAREAAARVSRRYLRGT